MAYRHFCHSAGPRRTIRFPNVGNDQTIAAAVRADSGMARRTNIPNDVPSLREADILSTYSVSVWIPGTTLRTGLTCQILVRSQSVEITTRPRFLGKVMGFDWIIPGSSILMTEKFRPHELGRKRPWIAMEPSAYSGGRKLCLQAPDMGHLVDLLRGVGATDAPASGGGAA